MKSILARDGDHKSPWQYTEGLNRLETDYYSSYDIVIIGGGITGITTAIMLQASGKKCLVLEAFTLGFGTTSGTSAHLNTFFDLTYPEIERKFSKDAAALIAEAGKTALDIIHQYVLKYSIDCDFEFKPGYLFAQTEQEEKQLSEILRASKEAGLRVSESDTNGLPIAFRRSLLFEDQAQFHPLKYIKALAEEYIALGGHIIEHSPVHLVTAVDAKHKIEAAGTSFVCDHLIYATHIPPGLNRFNFNCAPYRSYVVGVTLADKAYPPGMAYDMKDPYYYYRTHLVNGELMLLAGGEDHKTGQGDPADAFARLEKHISANFNVEALKFRWSSQYYIPADGLPYIGAEPGAENVYVATGYNGNGMIFGTLAAHIIHDLIIREDNPYAPLLSPSRLKPLASAAAVISENSNVAYHFIADRFNVEAAEAFRSVKSGSGKVLDCQGKKVAAYRDDNHQLHVFEAYCTHAGCVVSFNAEERSWDCPCHGGRFSIEGKVINGPPQEDLIPFDISQAAG